MVNILLPSTLTPEKVRQCWQDDEFFGYQFLNGANPMLLRRSTSLPSRLVLPSGMEELQTQLEKELQVPLPTLPCSHFGCVGRRNGEGEGPTMSQGRETDKPLSFGEKAEMIM